MHLWDGQEVTGKEWEACITDCHYFAGIGEARGFHGRLSTMIMYEALRERRDRAEAIPLPFKHGGGVLYHPSHVHIDCAYQGHTWCTPTPCTLHSVHC